MAHKISAPVGTWAAPRVKNKHSDVVTVQTLLKNASEKLGVAAYHPGEIDGKIHKNASQSATVKAILAYQEKHQKMQKPDGVVDVNGNTLGTLNAIYAPKKTSPKNLKNIVVGDLNLTVSRFQRYSDSVIGRLNLNGEFVCYTLEEPWRDNKKNVSCVPPSTYGAFIRYDSDKRQREWCIQLVGVPNRTAIQIHIGNDPGDTEGCVMVGKTYAKNFVGHSVDAYQLLQDRIFGPGYTRAQIRAAKPKHG